MNATNEKTEEKSLKRGLQNRHIQLIALGGAIGTGLFLGIGPAAVLAGPSVILGYALAGVIAFFIMRQLGEMVVEEPVSGSFSHFAYKYWGSFAGFSSGWNYWILYILVSMSELTAIGVYVHFWWPEIPLWSSSLFFFIAINALNLSSVKVYGEAEFWFSIIKVVAIIAMIVFGIYLLISGSGGAQASIQNLWNDGGFFPRGLLHADGKGGFQGLFAAIALIMFSFGGLELIGITAAEADQPEKTIPKATNQVIYRILIFYVGALVILFSLSPWKSITTDSSPFVMVFESLKGFQFSLFGKTIYFTSLIANVLNLIVLTAALSVYNSCVYSNSRMLYGLSKQGNAPAFLSQLNKNHVPVKAILVSGLFAAICIVVNKVIPEKALEVLMSLVVSSLIINWLMITVVHLKFKKSKRDAQIQTKFPSFIYPVSNYICLVFLVGILILMWITGMKLPVELIPAWVVFLYVCFLLVKRNKVRRVIPS
ncbi:amino acid permease [Chitinophaga ginsengisegetis]|uniref:amino acid permease n=1 Tax=Chitinophaga ginsengisegetis TaxID=393003 RepID=UPI000DBA27EB|nr:amino acid permease [Chitinophaga ginsengisegetis]MDR6567504.1 aromatic amino acid transport protein AroP [Chitinophaga ginsengisegetis]MDR6647235.1 aromatic amino acid transport protein AroP [Chitinophaga ginsengisegetis]MDR6653584.1 aromatic amino acid transport protein AroP [Chitinophaga ginsengisegetis]